LQGEFEPALRDCVKAIESKPYHAEAYAVCGAVLVAQGEWDNALTNLNKAIELNPGDPVSFCMRAWARCKTGERLAQFRTPKSPRDSRRRVSGRCTRGLRQVCNATPVAR